MGEGGWKRAFRRTTVVRIFAFRFQNRILEMMEAGRQSVEKVRQVNRTRREHATSPIHGPSTGEGGSSRGRLWEPRSTKS